MEKKPTKKVITPTRAELAAEFHKCIMRRIRLVFPDGSDESARAVLDQAERLAAFSQVHADALLDRLKHTKRKPPGPTTAVTSKV
jgi:hypothetical protein